MSLTVVVIWLGLAWQSVEAVSFEESDDAQVLLQTQQGLRMDVGDKQVHWRFNRSNFTWDGSSCDYTENARCVFCKETWARNLRDKITICEEETPYNSVGGSAGGSPESCCSYCKNSQDCAAWSLHGGKCSIYRDTCDFETVWWDSKVGGKRLPAPPPTPPPPPPPPPPPTCFESVPLEMCPSFSYNLDNVFLLDLDLSEQTIENCCDLTVFPPRKVARAFNEWELFDWCQHQLEFQEFAGTLDRAQREDFEVRLTEWIQSLAGAIGMQWEVLVEATVVRVPLLKWEFMRQEQLEELYPSGYGPCQESRFLDPELSTFARMECACHGHNKWKFGVHVRNSECVPEGSRKKCWEDIILYMKLLTSLEDMPRPDQPSAAHNSLEKARDGHEKAFKEHEQILLTMLGPNGRHILQEVYARFVVESKPMLKP